VAETTVQFVDSHCHLDDGQFDEDRAEVIARAREAGLKYMLSIGTGNGPPYLEHSFVYATVGVHPNDAPKANLNTFKNLKALLQHPKVKAIGEIGLDYHWGVPKEEQESVFRQQLDIAAEAGKPIVIHTRDAWDDTLAMLKQHWAPTRLPCLMHCFTGSAAQAEQSLELGFYLAFGGVVTFPKAEEVRQAIRITPRERLLIETDAPYLAPIPNRGKRNEPAFVVETARRIAAVRDCTLEEVASFTTANFERLFGLSGEEATDAAAEFEPRRTATQGKLKLQTSGN
jgi:TatD DNase family protein